MEITLKKAVAIKYLRNLPAPFILAKGRGDLAEKIMKIAEESGIEILEHETLADRLIMEDVGQYIPESVYELVAEILAFVYTIQTGTVKR